MKSDTEKTFIKALETKGFKEIYNKYYQRMKQEGFFDILFFAKEIGLKVFDANLPEDMSGLIKDKEILLNKKQSGKRQAFTLAHEIGHYILEHGDREDKIYFRKDKMEAKEYDKEVEANKFAAFLLMPEDIFKEKYKEYAGDSSKIANILKVSEAAAKIRAKDLKLTMYEWTI